MLSITVGIASDDTGSCSSDIVRCRKNVDKADMDILETCISLVCSKELAQLGFVVEGWLKDSIK